MADKKFDNKLDWKPEKIRTEFFASKKAKESLDTADLTFCVLGSQRLSKVADQFPLFKERILKDFKKAAQESFRIAENPYKLGSYKFTEGGTLVILSCEKPIAPFLLNEGIRKSLSSEVKDLSNFGKIVLDLQNLDADLQKPVITAVAALIEMASWKAPSYKQSTNVKVTQEKPTAKSLKSVFVKSSRTPLEVKKLSHEGQLWGQSVNLVRTLCERAGNDLTPRRYVQELTELCKKQKIAFEYWNEALLQKKNAGAFLSVSRACKGDTGSGIFILRSQSHKKFKQTKRLCLVGKGLCFDTGGYNLKSSQYIFGMHADMTGSAIALANFLFFRELYPQFDLSCYLAISENLVSEKAFKPNDVVSTASGLTIEIIDTDAEGRMVLSDTLYFASQEKPDLLVDYATLTGSAMRAVGLEHSAVFSNNEKVRTLAEKAGYNSGERVISFPIGGTFERELKSDYADIKQCSKGVYCDHIYASTFLSKFVASDVKWLHVDLSSHEVSGGLGLVNTKTTAFGVAFTNEVIKLLF